MEDPDWIEIAYVFDGEPSEETYESLLEMFPRNPGPEYGAGEFNINYQRADEDSRMVYADFDRALEAITTAQYCSIEIWMDGYGLRLGFSDTGAGLLHSPSVPYLRFSTTVYAFTDPYNEEHLDEVTQRRREFVDVLARAADILEPRWGFGRRTGLAIGDDETVEDLASMTTPPLYEYNVFRPETVEKLGRERVLSAPAWYVEELDSGGVFLVVREPPQTC